MAQDKAKTQVSPSQEKGAAPATDIPKTKTVEEAQKKLNAMAGKAEIHVKEPEETLQPTGEPIESTRQPQAEQAIEVSQVPLAPAEVKDGQLILTPKHLELIRTQFAKDATPQEFELFLMMAYRTKLDPLMKQLYFIKYGQGDRANVSYVTSIDGYRIIANRTGVFAGVDLPQYEYDKTGRVTHCAITVYKLVQNQRMGFGAKVKFAEYNTNKNNWSKMPETMIAKVAEAHALRKAFPNDLSGVYTQDEMDQAQENRNEKKQEQVQMITPAQEEKIKNLLVEREVDVEKIKIYAKETYRVPSMKKMTMKQAGHLIAQLLKKPVRQTPDAEDTFDDGEEYPTMDEVPVNSTQLADDVDAGLNGEQA